MTSDLRAGFKLGVDPDATPTRARRSPIATAWRLTWQTCGGVVVGLLALKGLDGYVHESRSLHAVAARYDAVKAALTSNAEPGKPAGTTALAADHAAADAARDRAFRSVNGGIMNADNVSANGVIAAAAQVADPSAAPDKAHLLAARFRERMNQGAICEQIADGMDQDADSGMDENVVLNRMAMRAGMAQHAGCL